MEKPPAPSKELSPIIVVNGVRGMRYARIRLELITKEFDFGTHGGVDVLLVGGVMGHLGCPFHGK